MSKPWNTWKWTAVAPAALLVATFATACASRSVPTSFASDAAASPEAQEAAAARVGVALAEHPPLPGEPSASWTGLDEGASDPHQHHHQGHAAPATAGGEVAVRVDEKGFTPSHVNVEKDKPLTLIFTRTSDDTCARDAVFPDLGIKKPLPKDTPVRIELPTTDARTFTFQCGMGMYKSNVVVQ